VTKLIGVRYRSQLILHSPINTWSVAMSPIVIALCLFSTISLVLTDAYCLLTLGF